MLNLCCCMRALSGCGKWGPSCGTWASQCGGFSCWAAQALGHMSLVAPWHVESSQTGEQTCVPCMGSRILNHWTTGGVLDLLFSDPSSLTLNVGRERENDPTQATAWTMAAGLAYPARHKKKYVYCILFNSQNKVTTPILQMRKQS